MQESPSGHFKIIIRPTVNPKGYIPLPIIPPEQSTSQPTAPAEHPPIDPVLLIDNAVETSATAVISMPTSTGHSTVSNSLYFCQVVIYLSSHLS